MITPDQQCPGAMPLSESDLTEWERLAAAATPGPWLLDRYGVVYIDEATIRAAGGRWLIRAQIAAILGIPDDLPEGHVEKNAAFISASRVALPALVAEVREARAQEKGLAALSTHLQSELDAIRCRAEAAENDYAAVAHAAGIEHVQDTGPSYPGPVDAVVRAIADGRRAEGEVADARYRAEAAEAENARLREALEAIALECAGEPIADWPMMSLRAAVRTAHHTARAALEGSSK